MRLVSAGCFAPKLRRREPPAASSAEAAAGWTSSAIEARGELTGGCGRSNGGMRDRRAVGERGEVRTCTSSARHAVARRARRGAAALSTRACSALRKSVKPSDGSSGHAEAKGREGGSDSRERLGGLEMGGDLAEIAPKKEAREARSSSLALATPGR